MRCHQLFRELHDLDGTVVAQRHHPVGVDHHDALVHVLERGLELLCFFAELALALAQRVSNLLQLGGLDLENLAIALEFAKLSAESPEQRNKPEHCAERTDRDKN